MTSQPLHIALAFDKNYLSPVYALLTSLFSNNRGADLVLHVIVDGVSKPQREELTAYVDGLGGRIIYYKIDQQFAADFLLPETLWWPTSIYFRLLFPALLPATVDRFLYLDTDTLVLKPLAALFAVDLAGKPVGAVPDSPDARPELGITNPHSYFNSGVLLIDRAEWLRQDISNKAIAFIERHTDKLINPDQDALNAVLLHNWHKLDGCYNLMFKDIPPDLAKSQYADFLRDTVVLHYTTQHKPWSMIGQNRLRHLYHDYVARAPRKYRTHYADFAWNRHRIREMLEIRLSEHLASYPFLLNLGLKPLQKYRR